MNIAQVKALLEQEPVRAVPEGVSEDPQSMDVYNTIEQEESIVEASTRLKELRWYMRVWVFLVEEQSWLFLFVLGTFGALVVLFVDFSIDALLNSRTLAADVIPWAFLRVLVWCVTGVGLAVIAGMCAHIISPHAAGSGIPEMKCILSGMSLTHYLSFRTFFAKCVGLTCAIASGLSVGKEGPYVHICSILSHQLTRMPMFRRVAKNDALRLQMIGAGCAVGVATTFGAPLGGVLFSIEVTSTYYLVHHLWKVRSLCSHRFVFSLLWQGFYCAVCGAAVVRLLGSMGLVALFSTEFDVLPYTPAELLVFVGLGAVFGFLAVGFITMVTWMASLKRRYRVLSVEFRYTQIVVVSLITALVSYEFSYLRNDSASIISDLFEDGDMKIISQYAPLHLIIFAAVRMVLTSVSVLLPIPCGLFTPVFLIGGALGRLVGELVALFSPNVVRGGYAVVGAAAFSGSVTRSLATSMILFELTGQLHHMLPVMLAVLAACAVANVFTESIYDVLLRAKKLPYMPVYSPLMADQHVGSVMTPVSSAFPAVPCRLSYAQLAGTLNSSTKQWARLPVVDGASGHIVGAVPWSVLRDMVRQREREYDAELEEVVLPQYVEAGISFDANAIQELLRKRAEFFEQMVDIPAAQIDYSPLQIVAKTPLSKAYFIFSMLSPSAVYVTDGGVLTGVLTKEMLIRYVNNG
jgi:chloride channel 2